MAQQSFDQMVQQYQRLVIDLIRKYYSGKLRHMEEDLAQEVWLKLWSALSKNESKVDDFKSYLYRTVQTTLWDAIRRVEKEAGPDLELEVFVPADDDQPSTDARLELESRMQVLTHEESLMIRAHLRGFNHEEIANLLAVSEGRVRNLLTRIKKKMAWGT